MIGADFFVRRETVGARLHTWRRVGNFNCPRVLSFESALKDKDCTRVCRQGKKNVSFFLCCPGKEKKNLSLALCIAFPHLYHVFSSWDSLPFWHLEGKMSSSCSARQPIFLAPALLLPCCCYLVEWNEIYICNILITLLSEFSFLNIFWMRPSKNYNTNSFSSSFLLRASTKRVFTASRVENQFISYYCVSILSC